MALQSDGQGLIRLFVTHVDSDGPFLRISGQLDKQCMCMVESLIESSRDNFEKGIGMVLPAAIMEGIICAAKYKDGNYYRAKVTNTINLANGLVGVHFIDYGNKDTISISTIRYLDNYDPLLTQVCGQASDYYLARIMHPNTWAEAHLLKLQSLLCYSEYPIVIEARTPSYPIISMQFQGNDLSQHLVANKYGIALPVAKQEVILMKSNENVQTVNSNWQPSFISEPMEHVPFYTNQHFPSNPASTMRLQQNMPIPFSGAYTQVPSAISQRLMVNRVSRAPVSLKAPAPLKQPQQQQPPPLDRPVTTIPAVPIQSASSSHNATASPIKQGSPKKSTKTYKSKLLEINSQHKVFVSYTEEGPDLFAVQLVGDAKRLQDMMDDINKQPHRSLTEPPMIGTVCLGRMSGDRIICRAIVMNLSGSQCKLFFVDFGDTEMVSYYDIFDIPEEFVKPNVFAMRFCLSGVKKLEKGPHLNEAFKQLVNGKILTLRVVAPEGPPLIQYGELYLDGKNVLDLLMTTLKGSLQFKWMEMLARGSKLSILVSYVDSCQKFFVQLSDQINELNAVMDAVKAHCECTSSPGPLALGAACCARFADDGNWYRARVIATSGEKYIVAYVDYGNEQEVELADLRTITPELMQLPAQALKCALKGYEDKPVETKTSNQLEMLALEKTLMAHVMGVTSSDTMLVTLVDDTVSPPMDVARKMMQLSQPRSQEPKTPTTPNPKDAPEQFSSPESPEDKKKGFRREKSFKDDRRGPKDGGDEFSQRSGSFRSREPREGFDRSGPGRQSDKYSARPDKGDRRGSKPWENNTSPPAPISAADDEWDTPAPSQTRQKDRDFRDKRKPRTDQQFEKPGWKSRNNNGPNKRLKQGEDDSQGFQKSSIQDRLRRENKFNKYEDDKKDDWDQNRQRDRPERRDQGDRRENWGDKKERGNWGDKRERDNNWGDKKERDNWGDKKERDNWGDKKERDNWGDKKERDNWGDKKEPFQKRDFRENRADRNDRPARSNFTPRDRADRSFGSDDKTSERSFNQDRSGRAPPFKSRGKFTQVQYKELPNPVPLETPYPEPPIEANAQHEVSVTWIISPGNFYTQILSSQQKFLDMMHTIPEMYKGVKPYTGTIPVGASVLAKYPEDNVLYRATIISAQPFGKFIVQYIDFGNKFLVDARDIWQLDSQLMELPRMAVNCSLLGVVPVDGEWKANNEIDLCFNAPRYQCVYQDNVEGKYNVSLWNNGVSVADTLIEKQLAAASGSTGSVTLKDEAIDLTIIVGQQILCRVTNVESYERFHVQLDLVKAALVESAIANIDAALLIPLSADSLADGVHCTVKHEDKIYRAILIDTSDTTSIKAVLPDYGINITTKLENLMILPTELSVYYYQSLECCFNNYTEESEILITLDDLKQQLTDKKLIIYINDVDGVRLVTTLYNFETGKKIEILKPDEGAYEEIAQFCTRSVFNYNFGLAYISHSENLNEIYLQKADDGDRLAELLDKLFNFYEEGTPEDLTSFEADGMCVAKSSDGNWYRSTILSSTETDCTVQFSDYGNIETVPKESLKKLDFQFYEPCALALVAGLGLVALQENALAKLREWTDEKELQVTLTFGSDGWLANLHLDGLDLSIKLVNENLATPQLASGEEQVAETVENPSEEAVFVPEGCTQVYISHIDSPGQFWLQMSDKVDTIEEIQAELQANSASYTDIDSREMGTLCIAKYCADDQWYRAQILDSDCDITTVRFIDYGNTDVLDNKPGLLKVIPDHMKKVEGYAIKCSVNAIPTGTGQWSEASSDYFTQLVGDLSVPVNALTILKDITTYVDIYVNGQNLTDKLVAEGHATRSEETECGGDLPTCFASHVNSPSEFWIQLETATVELQSMESLMVDAESFTELGDKEEGVICAAKYPEDGAWYRAQVIVDGSEGTEVLFMDYGNASIVTELRNLPDDLKQKPALSRKCALQKPRDIKSWSRQSEMKFNELAAEGATIFNVQFIASGDISIVELYLEGKSVTEELVGLCDPSPLSERPTPLGQDLQSSGKICHANSFEEFYVHLDSTTSDLEKIMERLIDASEFESVSELKVGSLCAAFWAEDEQWYRAKIIEFCDIGAHAQFIDYGNKAKCEDLRQLPDDLALIEPLAKYCRLATVEGSSEALNKRFDELIAEDYTFQIEFVDTTKMPVLVKLLLHGEDVTNIIRTQSSSSAAQVSTEIVQEIVYKVGVEEKSEIDIAEIELSHVENLEPTNEISSISEVEPNPVQISKECHLDQPSSELEPSSEVKASPVQSSSEVDPYQVQPSSELDPSSKVKDSPVQSSEDKASPVQSSSEVEPYQVQPSSEVEKSPGQPSSELEPYPTQPSSDVEPSPVQPPSKVESSSEVEQSHLVKQSCGVESSLLVKPSSEVESSSEVEQSNLVQQSCEVESSILVQPSSEVEPSTLVEQSSEIESTQIEQKPDDDLDTSQTELNESIDSTHTVIENKSFEADADALEGDATEKEDSHALEADDTEKEDSHDESFYTPVKNTSIETLERSSDTADTIPTPERDQSKESINTDTGYTSGGERSHDSDTLNKTNPDIKSLDEKKIETNPVSNDIKIEETNAEC